MGRVFDPNAWSTLTKALFGIGGSSSSSCSGDLLLPKEKKPKVCNLKQISEHVFELSNNPESPSAEIIFFHGLQVDSSSKPYMTTWLSKDGTELWLNWLLEEFLDVRILVVSYDASIVKTDDDGRLDMYLTCENLVQELMGKRRAPVGETGCPIILVGHCLGGLVLKELCVKVSHLTMTEEDECFKNFFRSVKGVFCYSSPHHGSEFPDCNTLHARGALFEDLNPLNAKTARQNEDFRKLRNKQKWRSAGVGESLQVTLGNFRGLVVREGSSRHDVDIYYTIKADHFDVCRPDSRKSTSYTMLADLVDQIIKKDQGSMVSGSNLPDPLVGLNSRVEAVRDKLFTESRIALVGMGGIGKTTLAWAVYERIQKSFDYACFYQEVKSSVGARETPQKLRDKIKTMLVDRRGQKVTEAFNWKELEGKTVLLVLDDTISEEQVRVMTTTDGFSAQSRLIVTARDKGFLRRANLGFYIHGVEELGHNSSKELFCLCAFGQTESPVDFSKHVEKFVRKCGGLPLALGVTGRFLFSKRKLEWECAFQRLQAAEALTGDAEDGLLSLLMISYDSLAKREKEMFLDAATCFHGKELVEVQKVWKYCGWADDIGWGNLLEKHLVKEQTNLYSSVRRVFVHEVLRDLGRSIAGRSRMLVASLNELSNEEAKVVKVVSGHVDDFDGSLLHRFSKLKVLWLDGKSSRVGSGPSDENVVDNEGQGIEKLVSSMDASALTEMSVVSLWGINDITLLRRIFTMRSLRFLKLVWRGRERGREYNIPGTLWAKIGNLQRLQALYIWHYHGLQKIPAEIDKLQNLQLLEIYDCKRLKVIPPEIGRLENLQSLKTCSCSNLEAIPAEIGQLKNLQSLDIRRCSSLGAIPAEIGQLKSLQSLHIDFCSRLGAIPAEIGQLENLNSLVISHCSSLGAIPAEIGKLKNLQSLDITGCSSLGAIPTEIGQLKNLQLLDITSCSNLGAIPTKIGQLKNLESLYSSDCSSLGAIPVEIGQLTKLNSLDISHCSSLGAVPGEIGQLKKLESLYSSDCSNLRAIPPQIGQLKNLQSLDISFCDNLITIPAELGQLKNLQSFDLSHCDRLKVIPEEVVQLQCLVID